MCVEEPAESSYKFDLSYDDISISCITSCLCRNQPISYIIGTHGVTYYYDVCINLKVIDFGETDMQLQYKTFLL